jgi:hypothetical protein
MSKIVNIAKQIFIKLRKSLGTAFYNKILQSSGPFFCGVRVTRSEIVLSDSMRRISKQGKRTKLM